MVATSMMWRANGDVDLHGAFSAKELRCIADHCERRAAQAPRTIDGTGWAEAAFEPLPIDGHPAMMRNRGLGYLPYSGSKI